MIHPEFSAEEINALLKIPGVRSLFSRALCAAFNSPLVPAPPIVIAGPQHKPQFEVFSIAGDDVILDHATGLMWDSEDALPDGVNHAKAIGAAAAVRKCGFTDWRAPTRRELDSFVDLDRRDPAADPIFNLKPDFYWSSTPAAGWPAGAWTVYFNGGSAATANRNDCARVRAVRVASQ